MATNATPDVEKDRQEILRLHTVWLNANCGLHINGMREVFVGGDKFHGFNLNMHTYYQVDEWARLWEYLRDSHFSIEKVDSTDVRITVKGDLVICVHIEIEPVEFIAAHKDLAH